MHSKKVKEVLNKLMFTEFGAAFNVINKSEDQNPGLLYG
jgi:hypothetical protein